MSNNNEQLIKVVEGKISRNSWLVNSSGKRISAKFVLYDESEKGDFVVLNTSKGEYVYHKGVNYVLLEAAQSVEVIKISDNLFGLNCMCCEKGYFARIYDAKGKLLLSGLNAFDYMSEGLFAVKKSDKWGFMDENLNFVIPPQWERVSKFNENGYAVVYFKGGKRIGVIDKRGSYVLSPVDYTNAVFETPDLLWVKNANGKCGVITVKGNVIIQTIYHNIEFRGNFFIVHANGKYGLIDTGGNEIFECIYPEIIETDKKFVVQDFARLEVAKVKEVTK